MRRSLESAHRVEEEARVKRHGRYLGCRVTVLPVQGPTQEQALLVAFSDGPGPSAPGEPGSEQEAVIRQLEEELRATRVELQHKIEELETANEDLKASNEEAMSMNEEMQSTNEELETAGEELRSMNEELTSVNQQLQSKVEELQASNDDIANLLTSSDVGTLFLDKQLNIKLFTPPVQRLLELIDGDRGRPLGNFSPKFKDPDLLDECRRVRDQGIPIEKEVACDDGRICLRRILPYRRQDRRIDGVVITFVDVSDRKRADARERRLAQVLKDSNDAIIVQDANGRIQAWNRGAEAMYGYSEAQALEMVVTELLPADLQHEPARLLEQLRAGRSVAAFETQRLRADGQRLVVSLTVTPLREESGEVTGLATTERDITQRQRTEQALQSLNRELEQRVAARTAEIEAAQDRLRAIYRTAPICLCSLDQELRLLSVNSRFQESFIGDRRTVQGRALDEAAPELARQLAPILRRSLAEAAPTADFEIRLTGDDGSCRTYLCSCDPGDRRTARIGVALQDITQHKLLQEQLLTIAGETQQSIGQTLHDDICQELTGLTLKTDALRLQLGTEEERGAEMAASIVESLKQTRDKVRILSHGLIPLTVEAGELHDALAGLLARTDEVYSAHCRFEGDETIDVGDGEVATQLFHIAQEALRNALRHSGAGEITVTLAEQEASLVLTVADDGGGLGESPHGLGLRIMKLRAERIGATLELTAGVTGGTRIRCCRPQPAEPGVPGASRIC